MVELRCGSPLRPQTTPSPPAPWISCGSRETDIGRLELTRASLSRSFLSHCSKASCCDRMRAVHLLSTTFQPVKSERVFLWLIFQFKYHFYLHALSSNINEWTAKLRYDTSTPHQHMKAKPLLQGFWTEARDTLISIVVFMWSSPLFHVLAYWCNM